MLVITGHLDSISCCLFPTELSDGVTKSWVGSLIKAGISWYIYLPL